jgi:hypothetical protein
LAREAGIEIEFLKKCTDRKEKKVRQRLRQRGEHEGLVCIFSAMEACTSYTPWHDKKAHKTFLKGASGKCLHYYFYFIDRDLGLCYLRVPTWAPFRLQFYFNGHNALTAKLNRISISFSMLDNSFTHLGDWDKAQELADSVDVEKLHRKLNRLARRYCPPIKRFAEGYHWSLMQVEYATDIVFKRREDLAPIYEQLVRTAVHAVKAEQVAMFLGRKLNGNYQGEIGNRFETRIQGTCIKHHMGKVSIKIYDKGGLVLRIETTANDVTFFKHHRRVEHRDGSWEMKLAPLKKSIYSLAALLELMRASNRRYLEFISSLDDPTSGLRDVEKVARPARDGERSMRGFNLFDGGDLDLFVALVRGEFNISGFQNHDLRQQLGKSGHQISRLIKRLRLHGLVKKVGHRYKYYLTALGRRVTATALRMRETILIPSLNQKTAA